MKTILIIGAGGLGREVVDIVQSSPLGAEYHLAFVDDLIPQNTTIVHGVQVLGDCSILREVPPESTEICVAVGDPAIRRRLIQEIEGYGLAFATVIDPSALIRPSAVLGTGLIIGAHAFLSCNTVIGSHVVINPGALVGHNVVIGPYSVIGGGASLSGGARIGEGTVIGAGASVLNNTAVGDWATVGMGAAVYSPVENGITVFGNPARVLPITRKKTEESTISTDSKIVTAPIIP
jgi:sugar O-acyltransferase (sialic acid O-acetyltransferase NeuD family)